MPQTRRPHIEGWIRQLNGDRLEIFLKVERAGTPDRKIRASGPATEMVELVEWFEAKTGMRVTSATLPRRAPTPIRGQVSFELGSGDPDSTELQSSDRVTP